LIDEGAKKNVPVKKDFLKFFLPIYHDALGKLFKLKKARQKRIIG
jgi:hypothetical protein